jgi:ATP-dependent protease ClpP protease subunit
MAKIIISGEIGWEITSRGVRDQLKNIDENEDLEIDLSSAGGSVFQGVEIGNLIRDHKGKTTVIVSALAASMGSYIMEMADVAKVHDNSSFMMHNPWMFTVGDFRDLEKDAKFLKSLSNMTSLAYSKKSGKSKEDVQKLMNSTTWLFGQEIVDAGFADEIIETDDKEEKEDAVAFAKLQFQECMKNLKSFEGLEEDNKKVAALFSEGPEASPGNGREVEPKGLDIKPEKKEIMNLEELKAKYPQLCAALVEEGKGLGKAELQDQVKGHIIMGESSGDLKLCIKNLKEQKPFGSAEVQAEYMAAGKNNTDIQNRQDDNPEGDIGGDDDPKLSEDAKEKALTDEIMKVSNQPAQEK